MTAYPRQSSPRPFTPHLTQPAQGQPRSPVAAWSADFDQWKEQATAAQELARLASTEEPRTYSGAPTDRKRERYKGENSPFQQLLKGIMSQRPPFPGAHRPPQGGGTALSPRAAL